MIKLKKFYSLILITCTFNAFIKIDAVSSIRFRYLNRNQKEEILNNRCSICQEEFKDHIRQNNNTKIIKLNCNHYFCNNCINQHINHSSQRHPIFGRSQPKCPNCRENINTDTNQEIKVNNQDYQLYLNSNTINIERSSNLERNSRDNIFNQIQSLESSQNSSIEPRVNNLERRFNHIQTSIDELEQSINSQDTRQSNNSQDIRSLRDDLRNNLRITNHNIDNLRNDLTNANENIQTLRHNNRSNATNIRSLEYRHGQSNNEITNLEKKLDLIKIVAFTALFGVAIKTLIDIFGNKKEKQKNNTEI